MVLQYQAIRCVLCVLFFTFGLLTVANPQIPVPIYYVKVLSPSGAVIAAPLEVASVEFTDVKHVVGQHNIGSFAATLRDTDDPANAYLQSTYNTLNYEQRVEIYPNSNLLGDPIFAGVITRLPGELRGPLQIGGESSLRRLATRKLRRYHAYNDTAPNIIRDLVKTYDVVFKDDFNRASIGTDWTFTAGQWDILNNTILRNLTSGATITSATSFAASVWDNAKFSFNLYNVSDNPTPLIYFVDPTNGYYLSIVFRANRSTFELYPLSGGVAGTRLATRDFILPSSDWNSFDIYTSIESGGRRIIVNINRLELFNLVDSSGVSRAGNVRFQITGTAGTQIDNVIVHSKTPKFQIGLLDADATVINQIFNGISHLDALEWIADHRNWEFRVRYRAGGGNDILDCGANIGTDMSADLIFEYGKNIVDMHKDRASDDLATVLHTFGQSQDDATSGFIALNLSAMDTFGIVESEFSDPQIVDNGIAKVIADNRLAQISAGAVSLSGTVVDESILWQAFDPARWGIARWGNFVWGSVKSLLMPGDHAKFVSTKLSLNESHQIIAITRRSGSPAIGLILDFWDYRRSGLLERQKRQLARAYQQFFEKLNSIGPFHLTGIISSPDTLTNQFFLRGQMRSVKIDIKRITGANSLYIAIDGTSRTTEFGGPWTGDVSIKDTKYLVQSGWHYLGFAAGGGGDTIDVSLSSEMLG